MRPMRTYRPAPVHPGSGESLAENSPHLTASWDFEANGNVTPKSIKSDSRYKAWWVCSAGHPRYRESVTRRMKGARCPLCTMDGTSSVSVVPAAGESLGAADPVLAAEWDWAANRPLTPQAIKLDSTLSAWWTCSMGHPRHRARIDLRRAGAVCPVCAGARRAPVEDRGSVSSLRPDLAAKWCKSKNLPHDPARTMLGSTMPRWWLCPSGHAPYLLSPAACNDGQGCPKCPQERAAVQSRKIRYTRSLKFHRPEVAAEWDDEYNGTLSPADVLPSFTGVVWWKCGMDHPRYSMSPAYRSKTGRGCAVCRKENPPITLSAENPDLAARWDTAANVIGPGDVTTSSTRLVWWICEREHRFRATVKHLHDSGDGCPLCLTETAGAESRHPAGWHWK